MAETEEAPKGIWDFLRKTAWQVWVIVLGLLLAAGLGLVQLGGRDDASISEQLADIRKEAASDSARTVVNERMDLRGTGEQAHLLVFRDDRIFSALEGGRVQYAPSDEIRIYEKADDELERRFRFQPEVPPTTKAPYVFRLASAEDLDGNGRPEVIGAYSRVAMGAFLPIPVVLSWDEASGDYVLHALLQRAPLLRRVAHPGVFGRTARSRYGRPVLLEDRWTRASVRGFGVESFALAVSDGAVRLIASYIQKAASHAARKRFEVAAWSLDLQRPRPEGFQCHLFTASGRAGPPTISSAGRGDDVRRQTLQRLWRDQRHRFAC